MLVLVLALVTIRFPALPSYLQSAEGALPTPLMSVGVLVLAFSPVAALLCRLWPRSSVLRLRGLCLFRFLDRGGGRNDCLLRASIRGMCVGSRMEQFLGWAVAVTVVGGRFSHAIRRPSYRRSEAAQQVDFNGDKHQPCLLSFNVRAESATASPNSRRGRRPDALGVGDIAHSCGAERQIGRGPTVRRRTSAIPCRKHRSENKSGPCCCHCAAEQTAAGAEAPERKQGSKPGDWAGSILGCGCLIWVIFAVVMVVLGAKGAAEWETVGGTVFATFVLFTIVTTPLNAISKEAQAEGERFPEGEELAEKDLAILVPFVWHYSDQAEFGGRAAFSHCAFLAVPLAVVGICFWTLSWVLAFVGLHILADKAKEGPLRKLARMVTCRKAYCRFLSALRAGSFTRDEVSIASSGHPSRMPSAVWLFERFNGLIYLLAIDQQHRLHVVSMKHQSEEIVAAITEICKFQILNKTDYKKQFPEEFEKNKNQPFDWVVRAHFVDHQGNARAIRALGIGQARRTIAQWQCLATEK